MTGDGRAGKPRVRFATNAQPPDGRITFARYALAPNRLGYCGGPDDRELLEYAAAGEADDGINRLIKQFQAAYPYICFIAESSGIGDPFDPRVIEAYWVGNDVLQRVNPLDFHEYLNTRIARRVPDRLKKYLVGKVPAGARPHHSFHVFDVCMRTGALADQVEILDKCRISWGSVETVDGAIANVRYEPVVLQGGKLAFGPATVRSVRRTAEGLSYLKDLKPGDVVSMHWEWICDRLTASQVGRLDLETRHHISLANETL